MLTKLEKKLGKGRVRENADLWLHTTLRTKVHAKYFFVAETREDLISAIKATHELSIPFYILGGGSNVVFAHDFEGLVVKNQYQKTKVLKEDNDKAEILFSSGYSMSRVVNETISAGYEGFEHHLGLPGTLGGAIYMNSKWTKPEVYCGDSLIYANIADKSGDERKVDKDYFQFAYDHSKLQQTGETVLEAVFELKKNDPEILKARAKKALDYRKATQPFGVSSSGCFFRNIDGKSAGEMIDRAGLKGAKVGNFIVSDKHANFILNRGDGDPRDLVKLLDMIKDRVKEKFGVELEREVILI